MEEAGDAVLYTEEEAADMVNTAVSDASRQKEEEILGRVKAMMENGEGTSAMLRELYPNEIVVAADSRYYFFPIVDTIPHHSYIEEQFVMNGDNILEYVSDGQVLSKKGIDVSRYQGEIDWEKVAGDGGEYAVIRLGIRGSTEGKLMLDETYEDNMEGALENGIDAGVYFFTQALNKKEAVEEAEFVLENLKFLGCRGTTGTEASFLDLFEGDGAKVEELNRQVSREFGFEKCFAVCGQTYPRKVDSRILNCLSAIAQSAYRMANDIRLLQHDRQVEEPFEKNQIGSSAMAYKRNPMRCERIAALARYLMIDSMNPAITAATQWFERTLDDSANKRLSIAEGFLCCDAVLNLYLNVSAGLVVYPKMIEKHLREELPFMATENIMMDAVRRGGDRQELHERIREHSMAAARQVKQEGKPNDLIARIAADPVFGVTEAELEGLLSPEKYVGCAALQTEDFLREVVEPVLERYKDLNIGETAIHV